MIVYIRENSWLAKMAARKLQAPNAAIVVGCTIYLWGASRSEFLQSTAWVKHETAHVYQYKKKGTVLFLLSYILQWAKHGYYHNAFEQEARSKENDPGHLTKYNFPVIPIQFRQN